MEYTIKLNEQQVELLKSIFTQIEPTTLIIPTPTVKTKKLSKTEKAILDIRAYRANKIAKKNR